MFSKNFKRLLSIALYHLYYLRLYTTTQGDTKFPEKIAGRYLIKLKVAEILFDGKAKKNH